MADALPGLTPQSGTIIYQPTQKGAAPVRDWLDGIFVRGTLAKINISSRFIRHWKA